jgi:hypothetical protein
MDSGTKGSWNKTPVTRVLEKNETGEEKTFNIT